MSTTSAPNVYQPGVCNIGPAEIRQRRRTGWIGAVVAVVAIVLFVVFQVPAPWRLLAFLPGAMAGAGFLQAGLHFCANFGMRGLFNVSVGMGEQESVMEADFRRADQRKAVQIIVGSVLIGAAVALIAVLV
jgi:hypothetical protein